MDPYKNHRPGREFDPGMEEFDRQFKKIQMAASVAWIVGSLSCLAFFGLVAWVLITLVNHFTS